MRLEKYFRSNVNDNTKANLLTSALFIIYLIALSSILLFKLGVRFSYMSERSVNLIPFNELIISQGKAGVGEVMMNVVIFIPLGIYAGVLFERLTFISKLIFFFLITSMFEGLQFILRIGAFDTTDLITNMLGGLIGLSTFEGIERLFNNRDKSQKLINIIATIGTVLMISLLLLLKINLLPIRYQ